jgi:DNA-binding NtrC family response regulator
MTDRFYVLIIDDQMGWYEAIAPILEDMNCIVHHVNTAKSAFLEIQNRDYSLIILDLRLTEEKEYDVQGLDILEKLSKREKAPPVIIWTGHATPALRQKAEWYKAFAFLEKIGDELSFNRDLFIKTVRAALPKDVSFSIEEKQEE